MLAATVQERVSRLFHHRDQFRRFRRERQRTRGDTPGLIDRGDDAVAGALGSSYDPNTQSRFDPGLPFSLMWWIFQQPFLLAGFAKHMEIT